MKIFSIALLLLSRLALAGASLQVEAMKGQVSLDGKALQQGTSLDAKGQIKTGAASFVKLRTNEGHIVVGPNSIFALDGVLEDGIARWKSEPGQKHTGEQIHTPNASFGVRGTNFWIKHRKAEKESEVVIFDGQVEFRNELVKSNSVLLKQGQWGGVGGKFGRKIAPIKDLDEATLKTLNEIIAE